MIKFSGNLSEECKYYFLKDVQKLNFFIFFFVSLPFIVGILIMAITTYWFALILLIPIIFLIVTVSLPPNSKLYNKVNKNYSGNIFCEIEIIDGVIYGSFAERHESKDFIDVKKVVDMGEWYKFYFYFPHKSNMFICEKKSLIEGTLEEFEELFRDKLVRQSDKK